MSAFICSTEHNQKVFDGLARHAHNFPWLMRKWESYYKFYQPERTFSTQEAMIHQMVTDLAQMNVLAYNERYHDRGEDVNVPGQASIMNVPSMVQLYKLISCSLYQCAEGSQPEKPLFKMWELTKAQIAEHIVSKLPEYDEAAWEAREEKAAF